MQNQGGKEAQITAATNIYELDAQERKADAVAALPSVSLTVAAGQVQTFESSRSIDHPRLWDTQHPQRYAAVTELTQDGKVVDRYETPFGIRSIKFDPSQGFLLNGKHVILQGVCGHHDLGALGAAFNLRAAERQLEILKEMGVNALRTSHNMPAPELLDLCDKMGILVMDESFDCWQLGKKPNDYHLLFNDWHERDQRAEYRRDRNHPSVIMWSLGNEIPGQGKPESVALFSQMAAIAHDEDPTRPATLGANHIEKFDPDFTAVFDLAGENYDPAMYAGFKQAHPNIPLFASETASTCSSRGIYFLPLEVTKSDFQVSSYDNYIPGWANPVETEFRALDENPWVAGEFVWTGFDYLGEPTPYNADQTNLLNFRDNPAKQAEMAEQLKQFGKIKSPSRSSYFGIVDLCGFKKDRFYLYQSRWRPDFPMAHLLPHWNWPDRVGQKIPVYVYSSGDEVELFLNGKSYGKEKRAPQDYRFRWDNVTYAPGELKAVAYKDGKWWAEDKVETTGKAVSVQLAADRAKMRGDGLDLCYVTARIADEKGLNVPVAQNRVVFSILSGPGEIIATDNGDATDLETFSNPSRRAFNGLALAIVRVKAGQRGDIRIAAASNGLKSGECVIHAE